MKFCVLCYSYYSCCIWLKTGQFFGVSSPFGCFSVFSRRFRRHICKEIKYSGDSFSKTPYEYTIYYYTSFENSLYEWFFLLVSFFSLLWSIHPIYPSYQKQCFRSFACRKLCLVCFFFVFWFRLYILRSL